MLHGTGHYQATGPRRDQQIDPSHERTWAITHDAILLIQKGIQRILVSQFNPSDPGKGMVKLLDDGDNILTRVQSTDAIMVEWVLKIGKETSGRTFNNDRQNLPTYHHHTNRGTGGSQPIERHQSIRHRRKGGCCRGRIKTGWHEKCSKPEAYCLSPLSRQKITKDRLRTEVGVGING